MDNVYDLWKYIFIVYTSHIYTTHRHILCITHRMYNTVWYAMCRMLCDRMCIWCVNVWIKIPKAKAKETMYFSSLYFSILYNKVNGMEYYVYYIKLLNVYKWNFYKYRLYFFSGYNNFLATQYIFYNNFGVVMLCVMVYFVSCLFFYCAFFLCYIYYYTF